MTKTPELEPDGTVHVVIASKKEYNRVSVAISEHVDWCYFRTWGFYNSTEKAVAAVVSFYKDRKLDVHFHED